MWCLGKSWNTSRDRSPEAYVKRWMFIGSGCFCPDHLLPPGFSSTGQRLIHPVPPSNGDCAHGLKPETANNVVVSATPFHPRGVTETTMVPAPLTLEPRDVAEGSNVYNRPPTPASYFEVLQLTPADPKHPFTLDLSQQQPEEPGSRIVPTDPAETAAATTSTNIAPSPRLTKMVTAFAGPFYFTICIEMNLF